MSKRQPIPPLDPLHGPIQDLVRAAALAGCEFRLLGCEVQLDATGGLDPLLLVALRERADELWSHLGGVPAPEPPRYKIHYPTSTAAAELAVAELAYHARCNMPDDLRGQLPPWLGLDSETAADPGHDLRPPIKLRKDGCPAKAQPALKETAGLDPHRSHLRLLQVCGGWDVLVFDLDRLPLKLLEPLLYEHTLILHNAGFDLRFLQRAGIDIERLQFEDTMQAAGLLYGAGNRSLDQVAQAVLHTDLPKGLQRSAWHAPNLSHAQVVYAAADAQVVRRLWPDLRQRLIETGRGAAYVLQRDVTRAAVRMVERGITLDVTAHASLVERWATEHAVAVAQFVATANRPVPETPAQVRDYLTSVLPPAMRGQWKVTRKTGELSTRAADLKRVAHLPGIRELLAVQQYVKLRNSFGASLVEKISPQDGRLHPSYNVAATKTGRASSNNPNIQQMPREQNAAGFRRCLTARPDYRLVVCDYGMMELRAAAYVSGDTRMAADFAEGVDIHRQLAASTLGIPYDQVTKAQRQNAKPISFSTIFGAGPAGLVATAWSNYGVELSLDTAQLALTHFFNRYPQFAQWMRSHHQECQLNGLIKIGRLGRVIEAAWETPKANAAATSEDDDADDPYLDAWDPGPVLTSYQPLAGEALKYTLACNSPIQGACADATMLALLGTDRALRAQAIDGGVVLCVHDELVLEVRADQVATAAAILQHEMRVAFEQTFPGAPTTGLLECHSGGDWAAAKP